MRPLESTMKSTKPIRHGKKVAVESLLVLIAIWTVKMMNEKNYEDFIDKDNAINFENYNHDPWAFPGPSSSSKNCMDTPVKSNNERMKVAEKECRYCRKKFENSSVYDDHFSECYDRYAYMHL